MGEVRWLLLLGAVAAAAAAPSAHAFSASDVYSGQSQPEIAVGGSTEGSGGGPGGASATRGTVGVGEQGRGENDGGLPFSGLDLLLIVGGMALILASGAGLGRLLANRQQTEQT
jgi:hypothetical protein